MTVSTTALHPSVVIRSARGSDAEDLRRLAALDSAAALSGPVLVAEVDDHIVAALDTRERRSIADPFVPTRDLVELLRMRARPARASRRIGAWAHPRARAA
jgi:hypothetical protein